jgi:hypothetical protein
MLVIRPSTVSHWKAGVRGIPVALLLAFGAACAGDSTGPSPETTNPADSPVTPPSDSGATIAPSDSTTPPGDSTATPPVDSTATPPGTPSSLPGIVFSSAGYPRDKFDSVYTGSAPGGALSPSTMLSWLSAARAKGARLVLKLCMGRDMFVKNDDGTFSFTKWKALVDRFKSVDFDSYIADGTITGHYLIDEPSRAERWGGKIISQEQIEAMAEYSKKIWPDMSTLVRVVPSWLAEAPVTYTYLDAAWFQYAARFGDPAAAVGAEVAVAKSLGLGLMAGMNVLDGGDGSSGISGWSSGKHSMSATEIRSYGLALLDESYICGFQMWMWDPEYYARSEIKRAMAELSVKARAHAQTSCRV